MQNNTNYPIIRTLVLAIFLFITSCTKTATTSDDTPKPITPVGNSEMKLKIAGADFVFVKTPLTSGHIWTLKTELSEEQYNAVLSGTTGTKKPKALNWNDAAVFCNKLCKHLKDSAQADTLGKTYAIFIKPFYTDTFTQSFSPLSIKTASYVAAFDSLPADSFKTLRLSATTRNPLKQRVALLVSKSIKKYDTTTVRNALLSSPDSVALLAQGNTTLLELRKHIRFVTGAAKIDTLLLDTLIKTMNRSPDSQLTFNTYRHILTINDSTNVSASLPTGYTLLNYNGSSDSAWNIVYFASRPADSILKKYPSILMPSPCTVTVRDNPIPVLVWNTDTNGVVRLPTAFEWEQAAICGSHSLLYSTNTGRLNMESAVYGKSASMETEGNSARAANPYGLVDMTGNLYEWVDTWVYKPYKGLKGGYYGSAAGDSTLLNLFTASGIPDSTYSGKTGFRPIIVGSPSVDSLLNMLKK